MKNDKSQVAAEHDLELVRKRGGQVLFGVAPSSSFARRSPDRRSSSAHSNSNAARPSNTTTVGHTNPTNFKNGTHVALPSPGPMVALEEIASGAGSTNAPAASPSPGGAEVPLTPSTPSSGFATAVATAAAPPDLTVPAIDEAGPGSRSGVGVGVVGGSPASVGTPELIDWGGAGGAGWGPWGHVDMQLVVGQASKHRVRGSETSNGWKGMFIELDRRRKSCSMSILNFFIDACKESNENCFYRTMKLVHKKINPLPCWGLALRLRNNIFQHRHFSDTGTSRWSNGPDSFRLIEVGVDDDAFGERDSSHETKNLRASD